LDTETFDVEVASIDVPDIEADEVDTKETVPEETQTSCDDSILKPFECPCESNTDCESGYCITTAEGKQCTSTCVEDCPIGWICEFISGSGTDSTFVCVPSNVNLCRPCKSNADCEDAYLEQSERCLQYGDLGNFCGIACSEADADCPSGFVCEERTTVNGLPATQCVAEDGVCACSALAIQQGAETACSVTTGAGTCEGKRVCGPDGLTECDAWVADEICDGLDNDCDGQVDENTCTAANAIASACVDGLCKILNCEVGFEDLDGNFETGCECKKSEEVCDGNDNDCDGQVDEGAHFILFVSTGPNLKPLYQAYRADIVNHLQTMKSNGGVELGYTGHHILGYCSTVKTATTPTALIRVYSSSMGDHFATINPGEVAGDPAYDGGGGTLCFVP
jgi:hypothetical protein